MKNHLWLALSVLAVAAAWGCNDEIKVENRTFQQLCEMSEGVYVDQDDACQCKKELKTCASGIVCISKGEYCASGGEECKESEVGNIKCSNDDMTGIGTRMVCTKKSDELFRYELEEECDEVSCTGNECGVCLNKESICDNSNKVSDTNGEGLYTCVSGQWGNFYKCRCINGTTCGDCTEKETRCVSGKFYVCSNNEWNVSDCNNGNSCDETDIEEGEYSVKCGECVNGATKCVDNNNEVGSSVYSCQKGMWGGAINSSYSCNVDKTAYGECVNGKLKCIDGAQYRCQNGVWSNPVTCSLNHSCTDASETEKQYDGSKCGVCADNDQRCLSANSDDNSTENAIIQICVNGKWENKENGECLGQVSCDDSGKLCASCKSGEKKCLQGPNGVGLYYQCVDEKWTEAVTCPNATSCLYEHIENDLYKDDSFVCGECRDGDTQCVTEESGSKVQKCVKGMWKDVDDGQCKKNISDISFDVSCNAQNTACGECLNNTTKCENGIQYECVNGQWTNAVACLNSASCISVEGTPYKKCGECENYSLMCIPSSDGQAYVKQCNDGLWVVHKECPTGGCDESGRLCAKCDNNEEKICNNNKNGVGEITACEDGSWSDSICDNVSCKFTDGVYQCGDCLNNDLRYDGELIKLCTDGVWKDWDDREHLGNATFCKDGKLYYLVEENNNLKTIIKECENSSCLSDHFCETVCSLNETRCTESGRLEICNDKGEWHESEECSNSCDYNGGVPKCGECVNSNRRCIGDDETSESKQFKEQTCVDGVWQHDTPCGDKSCNIENVCGECKNNSERCFDYANGLGEKQICIIGKWEKNQDDKNEKNVSCKNEKEYGDCFNGNIKCKNIGNFGYIEQCNNGVWSSLTQCNNVSCNSELTACGVCMNESCGCYSNYNGSISSRSCSDPCHGNTTWIKCYNGKWHQ